MIYIYPVEVITKGRLRRARRSSRNPLLQAALERDAIGKRPSRRPVTRWAGVVEEHAGALGGGSDWTNLAMDGRETGRVVEAE